MTNHVQYLALLAGCLLITLPLEFVLGAKVYRRPLRLLVALIPVLIIFSIWDVLGILRDHWHYNPRFVTGVRLFGLLPVEELAFFVVIPICGLLTYGAVGRMLTAGRRRRSTGEPGDA